MAIETVIAVVVTYNRKGLLVNCLKAIEEQTYPVQRVIIIDNASTDGTEEYIRQANYLDGSFFEYVRLNNNTGGAGGFSAGCRHAVKYNHDWLWLMDDDGTPSPECLANLLAPSAEQSKIRGPLVIDNIDQTKLSSGSLYCGGMHLNNVSIIRNTVATGIIDGEIHPFNGTLIHSTVFTKIGVPAAPFFIWGDEIEYMCRAKKAGLSVSTIIHAVYFHPGTRSQVVRIFGRYNVNYIDDLKRAFIYYRNHSYILLHYQRLHVLVQFIIKNLLMLIIYKRSWRSVMSLCRGVLRGISPRFKDCIIKGQSLTCQTEPPHVKGNF